MDALRPAGGAFPSGAYLNHLRELLVHPLLKVRRHRCARTLSASVLDEGGRNPENLPGARGALHYPTRQWDPRKERLLPVARLPRLRTSGLAAYARCAGRTETRVQCEGAEPMGAFGGLLVGAELSEGRTEALGKGQRRGELDLEAKP